MPEVRRRQPEQKSGEKLQEDLMAAAQMAVDRRKEHYEDDGTAIKVAMRHYRLDVGKDADQHEALIKNYMTQIRSKTVEPPKLTIVHNAPPEPSEIETPPRTLQGSMSPKAWDAMLKAAEKQEQLHPSDAFKVENDEE